MGWLITLGVLTALSILPLGVRAGYQSGGAVVHLVIGPFRFVLYPGKRKNKKQTEAAEKEKQASSETNRQKTTGGSVRDFLPLVRVLLDLLQDLRRKLRVDLLELRIVLGGGDPCDLAINYGRAWAALGNLMPQLERLFVIKKRNLEVACDFTSEETTVFARLDITITLGRLLVLAIVYGIRAIDQYIKIMNKRKGGAKV